MTGGRAQTGNFTDVHSYSEVSCRSIRSGIASAARISLHINEYHPLLGEPTSFFRYDKIGA